MMHGRRRLVFTLVGGAAADRYNRRVIVAVANAVVTLCTFILGILCVTGLVNVWHIILIAFITGVAFAFDGERTSINRTGFCMALSSSVNGVQDTPRSGMRTLVFFLMTGCTPVSVPTQQ